MIKILKIIGLSLCVFAYTSNSFITGMCETEISEIFWKSFSLGLTLISLGYFLENPKSGINFIIFSLILNNMLDEFIFSNIHQSIAEYISFLIIILLYIKYYACGRNKQIRQSYRGNS